MSQDYQLLKAAVRELKDELIKYCDEQKKISGEPEVNLQALSEKCNVHKMKLMQLLHWSEGDRADFISVEEMIGIIGAINSISTLQDIYEKSGPHVRQIQTKLHGISKYSSGKNRRRVTIPTSIILDFDNYIILLLASMKTKIADVLNIIDMQSYHKISQLEDLGFIDVNTGQLCIAGGGYADIPLEILKEHLPEIEKRFSKVNGRTSSDSRMQIHFGQTSEKGRKKINSYVKEFAEKVSEVLCVEKGDKPTFVSLWADTFTPYEEPIETQLSSETLNHVAHDLQKPYSMLKPLLCSFEQEQDLDKVKQRAKRAKKQLDTTLKSTKEMIANLRDVSLEQTLKVKAESFSSLLKECLEEKFLTSDLSLTFSYDLKHGKLLEIDREKVKRVINNALQNILTAVHPGASIEIQVASTEVKVGFTEISIKNTGSSCAPEALLQVFQPGYSSHGDELNQGVGAAIIKKFVELHGGKVWAESSVADNWFSIHFSLPCSASLDEGVSQLSENCHELSINASKKREVEIEALEIKIQSHCRNKEKKLVIVALDDVEDHLHHLRSMLFASGRLRAHVELLTFTNTQALKYVDLNMIDLVITDLDFAGEADGLELIKGIRDKGFKMPICAHSDYGINRAKEIYKAGADFIFEKPVYYEHLLKFIVGSM